MHLTVLRASAAAGLVESVGTLAWSGFMQQFERRNFLVQHLHSLQLLGRHCVHSQHDTESSYSAVKHPFKSKESYVCIKD